MLRICNWTIYAIFVKLSIRLSVVFYCFGWADTLRKSLIVEQWVYCCVKSLHNVLTLSKEVFRAWDIAWLRLVVSNNCGFVCLQIAEILMTRFSYEPEIDTGCYNHFVLKENHLFVYPILWSDEIRMTFLTIQQGDVRSHLFLEMMDQFEYISSLILLFPWK